MPREDAPTQPLRMMPSRMARHQQRSGTRQLGQHLPVVGSILLLVVGVGMLAASVPTLGDAAGLAAQAQRAEAPPPPEVQPGRAGAATTPAADPQPGAAASAVPATPPDGTPEDDGGAAAHGHGQPQVTDDPDRSVRERADGPVVNGLQTLGRSCEQSDLPPHAGLEEAPRCVDTAMGEVPAAEDAPQLLITSAPGSVRAGEPFTISVSSRNLVRDRFLGAADGGYYLESSFLNDQGLVRGHFHTGCRRLPDTAEAPDPAGELVFFEATEDARGGAEPDTVEVTVPGISEPGVVQCAVWAGDGSHRVPMMAKAAQFPAFDAVRLVVR